MGGLLDRALLDSGKVEVEMQLVEGEYREGVRRGKKPRLWSRVQFNESFPVYDVVRGRNDYKFLTVSRWFKTEALAREHFIVMIPEMVRRFHELRNQHDRPKLTVVTRRGGMVHLPVDYL